MVETITVTVSKNFFNELKQANIAYWESKGVDLSQDSDRDFVEQALLCAADIYKEML